MSFRDEFELLLRARYPVLYLPTLEEARVEATIKAVAEDSKRGVYTWDFVDGYRGNPTDEGFGRRNPLQALELVEKLPSTAAGIFVLRDFHRFLEDIAIARKLRNLARRLRSQPKNLVILAPHIQIPAELTDLITVLDFPLPSLEEIRQSLTQLLEGTPSRLQPQDIDELVRSCQGLSMERIRRIMARALASHGELRPEDMALVLEEKR